MARKLSSSSLNSESTRPTNRPSQTPEISPPRATRPVVSRPVIRSIRLRSVPTIITARPGTCCRRGSRRPSGRRRSRRRRPATAGTPGPAGCAGAAGGGVPMLMASVCPTSTTRPLGALGRRVILAGGRRNPSAVPEPSGAGACPHRRADRLAAYWRSRSRPVRSTATMTAGQRTAVRPSSTRTPRRDAVTSGPAGQTCAAVARGARPARPQQSSALGHTRLLRMPRPASDARPRHTRSSRCGWPRRRGRSRPAPAGRCTPGPAASPGVVWNQRSAVGDRVVHRARSAGPSGRSTRPGRCRPDRRPPSRAASTRSG